ncbi:MAG TPA: T9SS type A sorting domain-containing protein [Paludibacter sp.]|nr:T9SS type A sorting domain-containing protein [Paludibacter sp.]
MKKNHKIRFTLAILLAMLLGTANAQAVNYDLWIAGVRVTDVNKGDLTVINGTNGHTVTGAISYNSTTKTLTLNDATISVTGDVNGICSGINGLEIEVVGDNNKITANGWAAIHIAQPGTIMGSGTLSTSNAAANNCAIFVLDAPLTIKDCTLSATADGRGIMGNSGSSSEILNINNATVKAKGTNIGSIMNFNSINLTACSVYSPDGAKVTGGKITDADGSTVITEEVTIKNVSYNLKIAGVQVTDANKDDLTVINGTSGSTVTGSVTYNPNTNTLKLEDANIAVTGSVNGILSNIDGLQIEVVGTNNNVSSNGWAAIQFNNSGTIMGGGMLTASNSANNFAIFAYQAASLTIKDCYVSATAGKRGIAGWNTGETLTINNATVKATGTGEGSITGFNSITLTGCSLVAPSGAKIYSGSVTDADNNILKTEVEIIRTASYGLAICGVHVTGLNKDNLKDIPGVTGTSATYNPYTKTLRLEDANISVTTAVNGIGSYIEGLKIELVGNNTITANTNGVSVIVLSNSTTMLGGGKLTITNNTNNYACVWTWNQPLTIENCTLNTTGGNVAIGSNGSGTLTFNNATVTVANASTGLIRGFGSISFNGCSIFSPDGAKVTDGKVTDASGSTVITEEVTIKFVSYNLRIAGVQVTDANKNDLSTGNPCVTAGAISYNSDTKTLTLDNATISTTGNVNGIRSVLNGLKINLVGNNTITADGWCAIHIEQPGTIMGSGTLNASNSKADDLAIFVKNTSLTIQDCTVSATGNGRGIAGYNNGGTLIINNATVTATGTNVGSITDFSSINLNGCSVYSPDGAKVTGGKVTDADGIVITEEVTIKFVSYNLQIAGVQVTDANKGDLTVINGTNGRTVTGAISYDSTTKTLTLNGTTISIPNYVYAIYSYIDGLKIDIIGNNTVTSDYLTTVRLHQPCTIMGSGTLTVNSQSNEHAIFALDGASLTIKDCTVTATAGISGISGNGSTEILTINNATVTATGTSQGSISGFADITLTGCFISEPVGAVATKGTDTFFAVRDGAGTIITETVKIIPIVNYDLWIADVQVTNANKDNLSVINGTNDYTVTGSITYDSDSKTLRLENASIEVTGMGRGIRSEIEGFKIEVVGDNNITSDGWSAIEIKGQSGTILGTGTLNVTNLSTSCCAAICTCDGASLTIENCTVNATGGVQGIMNNNTGTLTINNATVTAKGTGQGSIYGFSNITLNDCFISEPAGAQADNGAVRDGEGNIIKGTVKIVPTYNLHISGVQVTGLNKDDLTSISGVTGTSVTYNPYTKTLTLDNATISVTGEVNGIRSALNGLKINVVGSNTITANGWCAVHIEQPGTIMGSGTLTTSNTYTNEYAIFVHNGASLTIQDCTLSATALGRGIAGSLGTETLIINNAIVTATGTNVGSITNFSSINLVGCFISEPADAAFDPEKMAICSSGTIVKTQVNIEKDIDTGTYKLSTHGLSLYPNPVNDILHIRAEKAVTAIRIYDINGTAVAQDMGENISEIKLAHLPAGIYMVRVETGEGVNTMRIIKQ